MMGAATLAMAPMLASADNARDWQNLPTDLNMVFGYYNRIDTNTPIDTSLPTDGLSLNANLYIARYARSFAVDGRNSAIQILQPYADIFGIVRQRPVLRRYQAQWRDGGYPGRARS
jgi:hypothetical protein